MTERDMPAFLSCFQQLAVALPMPKELADEELAELKAEVYFAALEDLPLSAINASVRKLARRGSGYFPSTQEWYQVADEIAYQGMLEANQARPALTGSTDAFERAKEARGRFLATLRETSPRNGWDFAALADSFERAVPLRNPSLSEPWCQDCGDSGWVVRWCVPGERCEAHQGVDVEWGEHDHAKRCSCRAMNPVIRRRLELRRRA